MSHTDRSGLFFQDKMKKEYRLKDSDKIGLIVKKRQKVASEYYTIYYQPAKETKIAVVAGKKIGDAVTRNYNKRVIREIVRPYIKQINNIHAVIVTKEQVKNINYIEKQRNLEKLIIKLIERTSK